MSASVVAAELRVGVEAQGRNLSGRGTPETRMFSVGVCATGSAEMLPTLLRALINDGVPENLKLKRVIIVASDCSSQTLTRVKTLCEKDSRLLLLEEPTRMGKAEAVNRIIDHAIGDFLVFVNSDALPEKGSIPALLESVEQDEKAGIVSASPYFEGSKSLVSGILELMWSLHNCWSLALNHAGLNNHASDELMVVKSRVLTRLPEGLVNDGAYLAGVAFLKGFSIKFSDKARVRIDVPHNLTDVIQQRRRIVFGHFQVWRWLGESPRTFEMMLWRAPMLSVSILVRRIAESPRLLRALPVAVFTEIVALLLAVKDILQSSSRHVAWRRYRI